MKKAAVPSILVAVVLFAIAVIAEALITREEFMQKISEERTTYQKLFNPTAQ